MRASAATGTTDDNACERMGTASNSLAGGEFEQLGPFYAFSYRPAPH